MAISLDDPATAQMVRIHYPGAVCQEMVRGNCARISSLTRRTEFGSRTAGRRG